MDADNRIRRIEEELASLQAQRARFKWIALGLGVLSPLLGFASWWFVPFGAIFAVSFYVIGMYIGKLNVIETEERLTRARSPRHR